jgi:hypothetical protein
MCFQGPPGVEPLNHTPLPHVNSLPSKLMDGKEPISTAFVESTVNLVVGKRFAKKQQMQWSKAGAHLLLQTRTQTLDGTLRETFRKWYPAMAANDTQTPAVAA